MSNLFTTNLNDLSNQAQNSSFVSSEHISPLYLFTQSLPNNSGERNLRTITSDDLSAQIVTLQAEVDNLKNVNTNYINTINQLSNQVNSLKSRNLSVENNELNIKVGQLTNYINQLHIQNNNLMKRLSAFGSFRS
jgi:peptidoglycan hydrolase CwlO-like protein